VLTAGLTAASVPPVLLWTVLWPLPLLCFALFAVANPQLSAFVRRSRGTGFLLYFTAVHLLVNLTLAAGLLWGTARIIAGADVAPDRTRRAAAAVVNPNRVERQAP
jgi:hypothetical protein